MHRHQPHRRELLPGGRAVVLAVQRRLPLAIAVESLVGKLRHEVQEPAEITTLAVLVLAREAHELAHVGQPSLAAGHREHAQVVAAALERALDQAVERAARCPRALGGEQIDEALHPRPVGRAPAPRARRPGRRP